MFSTNLEWFWLLSGLQWNDPKTADVNLLLQDLSVVETHRVSQNSCMTPLDIRQSLHNVFFCFSIHMQKLPEKNHSMWMEFVIMSFCMFDCCCILYESYHPSDKIGSEPSIARGSQLPWGSPGQEAVHLLAGVPHRRSHLPAQLHIHRGSGWAHQACQWPTTSSWHSFSQSLKRSPRFRRSLWSCAKHWGTFQTLNGHFISHFRLNPSITKTQRLSGQPDSSDNEEAEEDKGMGINVQIVQSRGGKCHNCHFSGEYYIILQIITGY